MNIKPGLNLCKTMLDRYNQHNIPRLGASLAYYTAFSIAPLLLLVIAFAGYVFGPEAAEGKIVAEFGSLMGKQSADVIQSMVQAAHKPTSGLIATVVGFGILLIGASGVMSELKGALNLIWDVPDRDGIGSFVLTRLLSVGMVLVIGFLLLVSLVVSTAITLIGSYFGYILPVPPAALQLVNFLISFVVTSLLFATLFKGLPDAHIQWRDVWIGSAITSFLFSIGKFLLGLYLGRGIIGSSYGAAGSLLVMLLWVYYSAQVLYVGAEFTKIYADKYGSGVRAARRK